MHIVRNTWTILYGRYTIPSLFGWLTGAAEGEEKDQKEEEEEQEEEEGYTWRWRKI